MKNFTLRSGRRSPGVPLNNLSVEVPGLVDLVFGPSPAGSSIQNCLGGPIRLLVIARSVGDFVFQWSVYS